MKIVECDVCKTRVNGYGNTFDKQGNIEKPRSMYILNSEFDVEDDDCDFTGIVICHHCLYDFLYRKREENE